MASTREVCTPEDLDKNSYLFKDVLECEPSVASKFCTEVQKHWNEELSKQDGPIMSMDAFKKSQIIHLVWISDKFHKKTPDDDTKCRTYQVLSNIYNTSVREYSAESTDADANQGTDAEADRTTERQLIQHLKAFLTLIDAAKTHAPLSEEMIKRAHGVLMQGLHLQGTDKDINAGEYRQIGLNNNAGHTYIDHKKVPESMNRMVGEYNRQLGEKKTFELSSWLLMKMLQIHPFNDGNGRISRLLWCYSLFRDGLPFPVTPFPGRLKAYDKYIWCIRKDEHGCNITYKNLTSLTLISVDLTWRNFLSNFSAEYPKKFEEIYSAWLHSVL